MLEYARQSIRIGLESFAPDGGWQEGPTYWIYGTRYLAYAGASLQSALDTDWGLSRVAGLGKTGLFRIYVSGPTDQAFNFGDASANLSNSAQLFWLSRIFDRPEYAAWETKWIGRDVGIFDLLWYKPADEQAIAKLPLDARFRGAEMISLRGSWDDPNATFVAFKGGSMEFKHSHIDFGTFVLDAQGERWAIDLGGDSYELPAYFGDKRTSYYRTTTRGHNTFTIDNRSQNPKATVPIKTFFSTENRAGGFLDMDDAYRGDVWHARRGIELIDRRQVLVQDEIDPSEPAEIVWSMHTNAEVHINRSTATLRQNGKILIAQILSPADARFDVLGVRLNPPQEPVSNVRRLYIRLPSTIKKTTIAVLFTPGEQEGRAPRIEPLSQWGQVR